LGPRYSSHQQWNLGRRFTRARNRDWAFAKTHFVDHTQHDTLSVLKTIELIFGLTPLNNFDANASSLASSLK